MGTSGAQRSKRLIDALFPENNNEIHDFFLTRVRRLGVSPIFSAVGISSERINNNSVCDDDGEQVNRVPQISS